MVVRCGGGERCSLWSLGLVLCPSLCALGLSMLWAMRRALIGRRRPSPSALRFASVRGSLRAPGTSAFGHVSRGNVSAKRGMWQGWRARKRSGGAAFAIR